MSNEEGLTRGKGVEFWAAERERKYSAMLVAGESLEKTDEKRGFVCTWQTTFWKVSRFNRVGSDASGNLPLGHIHIHRRELSREHTPTRLLLTALP